MRYLKVIIILLFSFAIVKFWNQINSGYRTSKILPSISIFSTWEVREKVNNDPLLWDILSQPFSFLGRGQQCYTFLSEDEQYVLKLFRLHKFTSPFWSYFFPAPSLQQKKQKYWNFTLISLQIAETTLKEETGLLFTHMQPTTGLPLIEITDPIGRKSLLDSNDLYFVIQKKVEPVSFYLEELLQDEKKLHDFIYSYIETVTRRAKKKIRNKNRNILKNIGFYKGKIIEYDIGEFRYNPALENLEGRKLEVVKSTKRLRKWLEKKAPYSVTFLDSTVKESYKELENTL